jgi:hypothetical protein
MATTLLPANVGGVRVTVEAAVLPGTELTRPPQNSPTGLVIRKPGVESPP